MNIFYNNIVMDNFIRITMIHNQRNYMYPDEHIYIYIYHHELTINDFILKKIIYVN